ncbi:MAG: TM0106 family RecB-like putative nuclease, partial [Candidatus Obscuribacterales bacterium]|nr:TM0106 family RecB-like putative nuclease [Candidatus Obscuribacterales bacterium]
MRKKNGSIVFSPSDLITFMADQFSSWMDRNHLENPGKFTPDEVDEGTLLIQKHGIRHEVAFLNQLQAQNKDVCTIPNQDPQAAEKTIEAMKAGREVIYQGYLSNENFAGYSDFLIRTEGKSKLGDFNYEVWDSKLAKKAKPYFLVQLCCYAEMLETIQGILPNKIAVVLGDKEIRSFRTLDYYYYYKSLKQRFIEFQNNFDADKQPDWLDIGDYSRWKSIANEILEQRDDLIRIANIRKSQVKKLKESGITTLSGLAETSRLSVAGISQSSFNTLKAQAQLQLGSKNKSIPLYEILPPMQIHKNESSGEENILPCGLALLPPKSKLDVFFDMEGYPHIEGGLEYLFGVTTHNDAYKLTGSQDDGAEKTAPYNFDDWWGHDRNEEKQAFEAAKE